MAFFDTLGAGEMTTRIVSDMTNIQEAITSKISLVLIAIATFAAAVVIAYVYAWRSAVILSPVFIAAMVVSSTYFGRYSVRHQRHSMEISSRGSNIAEEAISSPRHISAFGVQEYLANRYLEYLRNAVEAGTKAGNLIAPMVERYALSYLRTVFLDRVNFPC